MGCTHASEVHWILGMHRGKGKLVESHRRALGCRHESTKEKSPILRQAGRLAASGFQACQRNKSMAINGRMRNTEAAMRERRRRNAVHEQGVSTRKGRGHAADTRVWEQSRQHTEEESADACNERCREKRCGWLQTATTGLWTHRKFRDRSAGKSIRSPTSETSWLRGAAAGQGPPRSQIRRWREKGRRILQLKQEHKRSAR